MLWDGEGDGEEEVDEMLWGGCFFRKLGLVGRAEAKGAGV